MLCRLTASNIPVCQFLHFKNDFTGLCSGLMNLRKNVKSWELDYTHTPHATIVIGGCHCKTFVSIEYEGLLCLRIQEICFVSIGSEGSGPSSSLETKVEEAVTDNHGCWWMPHFLKKFYKK